LFSPLANVGQRPIPKGGQDLGVNLDAKDNLFKKVVFKKVVFKGCI
jgi:hypothetical protein